MKFGIIILFTIFYLPTDLYSQQKKFNINFLGVSNGLTSGNVRKIAQDQYGFLWIATQDGLFRYDSKNFLSYNTQSPIYRRIEAPDIRDLQIDSTRNLIWLSSSYGGINGIDLLTGKVVKNIPQSLYQQLQNNLIKTFCISNDIALLGCENGLFKLGLFDSSLTVISLPGLPASVNKYIDLIQKIDSSKFMIFCRDKGIFIFDLPSNKVLQFIPLMRSKTLKTPLQFYNCTTNNKNLFCITTSSGPVFLFWKQNEIFFDSTNFFFSKIKLLNAFARRAIFDQEGNLWIATNKGLFKSEASGFFLVQNNDERNFDNNWLTSIYSLCVDAENNLWLGCQNGLASLNNTFPAFISHSYSYSNQTGISHSYHLLPLNDSIVYSTAEDGLYKINSKTNTITCIEKGRTYDFIFIDPFGHLFASNSDGLYIIKNDRKISVPTYYPEFTEYFKNRINSVTKLNDSCLVMGTENLNGILIWNYISKKVTNIHTRSKDLHLFEDIINYVYSFDRNKILILSDASLSLLNYNKKSIKKIPLKTQKKDDYFNIFFDVCKLRDTLFIACYGQGVVKINKNFQVVGLISTANGLNNNGVYKLLPWKDSVLFITTNNGLTSYNSSNGAIKHFFKDDGLHDNAFEETSGTIYEDHIYAGGTNGFSVIFPERIKLNNKPPLVYTSSVTVEKSDNIVKDTFNIFLNAIQIPNDALHVVITFPTISYKNRHRITFQYRITELHNQWIFNGTQNNISPIGLSPGAYHLQVQAFNEDGVPSEIKELTLIFLPKWYQTWWFKVLTILAAAAIFYGLYRFRINHLKKEEKIRIQVASDLHDELGSTLNSVKVFTNLALMEKENKSHLEKIKEATQSAISGVKDIIWVLDDKRDTLDHLLVRINQFARPICEANGISYNQQSGGNENYKLGKEEKRNLYMIIKESINNSIKYAECSVIELLIKNNGGKLSISISDDGKGFDKNETTSGYGLRNMKHRAGEIGYHAEINSSPGNGTLIYL
jgi:ligand-binding sensor domain-containing protein/two-component sensor histidine kinase